MTLLNRLEVQRLQFPKHLFMGVADYENVESSFLRELEHHRAVYVCDL